VAAILPVEEHPEHSPKATSTGGQPPDSHAV
jgi:hypothetical protein